MRRQDGFTLIELMLTVVIIAILAAVAVPGFRSTIASIKVRGVAESITSGLQYARSEAVKRNQQTTFQLNNDSSWTVKNGAGTTIQSKNAGDGQGNMVTLNPTTITVVYTSLGTITSGVTQVDISTSSTSATYRVKVGANGGVKMCNPSISSTSDPKYCT